MSEGYRIQLTGTWYQWDRERGRLMPVRGENVDLTRPAFTAPGRRDADVDQRDEHCSACGDELTLDDGCGCPPGEWVEIGYTTEPPDR